MNPEKDSVVNKSYICTPQNKNENNQDEGYNGKNIKNQSEEELLKQEDEMHEFDTSILQFKITNKYIKRILSGQLSNEKTQEILRKINNINILNLLYGKKTSQILSLMK